MALRMCLVGFALVTLRLIIGGGLSPSVCELAQRLQMSRIVPRRPAPTTIIAIIASTLPSCVCVYVNGDPSSSFFGTQPQLLPTVLLAILMLLRLIFAAITIAAASSVARTIAIVSIAPLLPPSPRCYRRHCRCRHHRRVHHRTAAVTIAPVPP